MKNKIFLCSFCGESICTNKANLIRHEKIHNTEIRKIVCKAQGCGATFKHKSDYYRHWSHKHKYLVIPDGLDYITEKNHAYKRKRPDKKVKIDGHKPEYKDFLVLSYLGLMHSSAKNITMNYPHPAPFFGELAFNDCDCHINGPN